MNQHADEAMRAATVMVGIPRSLAVNVPLETAPGGVTIVRKPLETTRDGVLYVRARRRRLEVELVPGFTDVYRAVRVLDAAARTAAQTSPLRGR